MGILMEAKVNKSLYSGGVFVSVKLRLYVLIIIM